MWLKIMRTVEDQSSQQRQHDNITLSETGKHWDLLNQSTPDSNVTPLKAVWLAYFEKPQVGIMQVTWLDLV